MNRRHLLITLSTLSLATLGAIASGCGSSGAPAGTRSAAPAVRSCPEVAGAKRRPLTFRNETGATITLGVSPSWRCDEGKLGAWSLSGNPSALVGVQIPGGTTGDGITYDLAYYCGRGEGKSRKGAFDLSFYAGDERPTILPLDGRPSVRMNVNCANGAGYTVGDSVSGGARTKAKLPTTLPDGTRAEVELKPTLSND